MENIGARRLHTLIEELLDEVAFSGGENGPERIEMGTLRVANRTRSKKMKDYLFEKHQNMRAAVSHS